MIPWGPWKWLLGKIPPIISPIKVVGCLGAEERCVAIPRLASGFSPASTHLVEVVDTDPYYRVEVERCTDANRRTLHNSGVKCTTTKEDLLAGDDRIENVIPNILVDVVAPMSLVIDITSLPKRFFFQMILSAIKCANVHNLIVTYTQPSSGRYTTRPLAENAREAEYLPGFGLTDRDPSCLVASVGFETLGLDKLLADYRANHRDVYVLFPFPPGMPYTRRIWGTLMAINVTPGDSKLFRVGAIDADRTIEELRGLMNSPNVSAPGTTPVLAPYGPKPISLGMCLHAIRQGWPVIYTQPLRYHPQYTRGIGASWAYAIKIGGRELF